MIPVQIFHGTDLGPANCGRSAYMQQGVGHPGLLYRTVCRLVTTGQYFLKAAHIKSVLGARLAGIIPGGLLVITLPVESIGKFIFGRRGDDWRFSSSKATSSSYSSNSVNFSTSIN